MKLDKEICKSCHSHHLFVEKWGKEDDVRWEEGNLFCVGLKGEVVKNNAIPKECKMRLEHLVQSQPEKRKKKCR